MAHVMGCRHGILVVLVLVFDTGKVWVIVYAAKIGDECLSTTQSLMRTYASSRWTRMHTLDAH